jgi:hypothetical protein
MRQKGLRAKERNCVHCAAKKKAESCKRLLARQQKVTGQCGTKQV